MFAPSSTLPPVVYDSDPRDYHAESKIARGERGFVMSRSALWEFGRLECPLAWRLGAKEEPTKAMVWGDLVDTLWLTPERFEQDFSVTPEVYNTDGMKCPKCGSITDAKKCKACGVAREECKIDKPWNWNSDTCSAWRDAAEKMGRKVVMPDTVSNAHKAVKNLREHPRISKFHEVSRKQVVLNVDWHDEATGLVIPVKCLLDMLPDPASDFGDTIPDFKTTALMRYNDWSRHVHKQGLDYQAAFYCDAATAAFESDGLEYRKFEHHIQASYSPWLATTRMLSADFITIGRNRYRADFAQYCQCLAGNQWPSYDCAMVEPSAWMLSDV